MVAHVSSLGVSLAGVKEALLRASIQEVQEMWATSHGLDFLFRHSRSALFFASLTFDFLLWTLPPTNAPRTARCRPTGPQVP